MLDSFVHVYTAPAGGSGETLLLLHGTGGDERDLLTLGAQVGGGAGLLSPRGKVLENGMPRFFRRLALGVFDEEDVKYRAHELGEFVSAAAARYRFDPGKVTAVGYSNGANIAAGLLLLHPGILSGAVLLRPMVPLIPERVPDLKDIGVFVAGGKRDPIVRPEQTEKLVQLLRSGGAEVEVRWTAGGHELSAGEPGEVKGWLSRRRAVPTTLT